MREGEIRKALHDRLRARNPDPRTLIVDELAVCMGVARVDVAVVNGSLQGYEIKSEQDTLDRLPGQATAYSRVFETVTLVSTERHLDRIRGLVPAWWGLWEPRNYGTRIGFRCVRRASHNPEVEPGAMVQLLWRDEVLDELEGLGRAAGVRSKPKRALWKRLAESVSPTRLAMIVRHRLKSRRGWRSA